MKIIEKKQTKNLQRTIFSLSLQPQLRELQYDSVAQPVEHNTFNVGVLGSNPSWITKRTLEIKSFFLCDYFCLLSLLNLLWIIRQ